MLKRDLHIGVLSNKLIGQAVIKYDQQCLLVSGHDIQPMDVLNDVGHHLDGMLQVAIEDFS